MNISFNIVFTFASDDVTKNDVRSYELSENILSTQDTECLFTIMRNPSDIPSRFRNDHFGAEFMKLLPQFLRFEVTLDTGQLTALRGVYRAAVLTRLYWLSRLPARRTVPGVFHEFLCNTDGCVWCFYRTHITKSNVGLPINDMRIVTSHNSSRVCTIQTYIVATQAVITDIHGTDVHSDVTIRHYRHTRDGRIVTSQAVITDIQ